MISKLQSLSIIKLKFHENVTDSLDQMVYMTQTNTFVFEEDRFSKGAQGGAKKFHEVLLLMNFSQKKPQVKNVNLIYYELNYTISKISKKLSDGRRKLRSWIKDFSLLIFKKRYTKPKKKKHYSRTYQHTTQHLWFRRW